MFEVGLLLWGKGVKDGMIQHPQCARDERNTVSNEDQEYKISYDVTVTLLYYGMTCPSYWSQLC